MEYQSGKASRPARKGRKSTKIRIVVLILVILTAGVLTAGFLYPERMQGISDRTEQGFGIPFPSSSSTRNPISMRSFWRRTGRITA